MAMECPECFTCTRVIRGEPMTDTKDRPSFRRDRVCINEACSLYMIRLRTMEVYAPLQDKPETVPVLARFPDKPPRTDPLPTDPIPGVNA